MAELDMLSKTVPDDIPYVPRPPITGRTGPRPGY